MGEKHHDVLRGLWVIAGVLDEGYDMELLNHCVVKHRTQGTIP